MANPLRQRLGALLSRPAAPASLRTTGSAVTKRFFASKTSHAHDDAEETAKWRSITIAAYATCILLGAYILSHEEHGHVESPEYSYLHIRNKEFPWGSDGLFEYKHDHEEH